MQVESLGPVTVAWQLAILLSIGVPGLPLTGWLSCNHKKE